MAAANAPPPELSDPLFGHFKYDTDLEWYEGRAVWNGRAVELFFCVQEASEIGDAVLTARRLWEDEMSWSGRVLDAAVADVFPFVNRDWRLEGDPAVTADEFRRRVFVENISVGPDGFFVFSYDDDGLACGPTSSTSRAR